MVGWLTCVHPWAVSLVVTGLTLSYGLASHALGGIGKRLLALVANRLLAILTDLVGAALEPLEGLFDLLKGVAAGSELLEEDAVCGHVGGKLFQIGQVVLFVGAELIEAVLQPVGELPEAQGEPRANLVLLLTIHDPSPLFVPPSVGTVPVGAAP